ncbi:MAG: hypothetical protein Ta2G_17370 [Termitinemataceae bacterium]|nr:MAG: hypothetical protein Ta2G_17370 [Termitinemataceae bacterium]
MLENIVLCEDKNITIDILLNNLFGLYNWIEGSSHEKFSLKFHEYWDFLEEIFACDRIIEYDQKIYKDILPKFKISLCDFLNSDKL